MKPFACAQMNRLRKPPNIHLIKATLDSMNLARVFIDQLGYPLHVIDGFTVRTGEVRRLSSGGASSGVVSTRAVALDDQVSGPQ